MSVNFCTGIFSSHTTLKQNYLTGMCDKTNIKITKFKLFYAQNFALEQKKFSNQINEFTKQ